MITGDIEEVAHDRIAELLSPWTTQSQQDRDNATKIFDLLQEHKIQRNHKHI